MATKGRKCLDEQEEVEIVYCRAIKCAHNEGDGKCDITRVDTKISVDEEGRCDNYSVRKK